jgi:hypothetical protein
MHILPFAAQVIGYAALATVLLGGMVKLVHTAQSKAAFPAFLKMFTR